MSVTQVRVVLSGGPAELAGTERSVPASELDQKLKLIHHAGYEHFVHDGEFETIDGCDVAVFHWTYRTKIAE